MLAVHGHGPGKSRVCGLDPEARPGEDYAAELARRGHLVLAPDLRCFGERADWNPPDHYACDTNLVHQFMGGWTPLTQNLWDLARCLDVLAAHPLVDPARIGAVGFSYGATTTLFLAAIDARVAAAVVSGFFSSWAEAHKVPWNMCGSQVLSGMLGEIEHVDLGALVAPRPLLVESGREDLLFPVDRCRGVGCRRLAPVYDQAAAGDRLVHDVFDGEHQWHGGPPTRSSTAGSASAGRLRRPVGREQRRRVGVEEDRRLRGALEDRGGARVVDRSFERGAHRLAPCVPRARSRAPGRPGAAPGW